MWRSPSGCGSQTSGGGGGGAAPGSRPLRMQTSTRPPSQVLISLLLCMGQESLLFFLQTCVSNWGSLL